MIFILHWYAVERVAAWLKHALCTRLPQVTVERYTSRSGWLTHAQCTRWNFILRAAGQLVQLVRSRMLPALGCRRALFRVQLVSPLILSALVCS